MPDYFKALAAPFPAKEVEWRVGSTNREKSRGLALAYISARAVMDRLDEVVGPMNWADTYAPAPQGGVLCTIALRINDEWLSKQDAAENTDIEAVKGGISDAFKRAAVKWGIGRYLYRLDSPWVDLENGRIVRDPVLPAWALPEGEIPAQQPPTQSQTPFQERMGHRREQAERRRDFPAKASEVKETFDGASPAAKAAFASMMERGDVGEEVLAQFFVNSGIATDSELSPQLVDIWLEQEGEKSAGKWIQAVSQFVQGMQDD